MDAPIRARIPPRPQTEALERYYVASQAQLIWRKFRRHKLALVGGSVLLLFYVVAIFADFLGPYDKSERTTVLNYQPPQLVHFLGPWGFGPGVYAMKRTNDPKTLAILYTEDPSKPLPIHFFVRGAPYKLWGIFKVRRRLFGVDGGKVFLIGTDELGRDVFSRLLAALRISLFVGLVGIALSFLLGIVLGGLSGYLGGRTDLVVQRFIEFLLSIPTIPFWLALSAALPPNWSSVRVFFGVTIILSIVGWCGIARVVRGKFLELREHDFIMAARIAGATNRRIIFRHLVPSFFSYLVVQLTLAIPAMILGETALSFLGLGIRAPAVSLGTLLQDAQNVREVSLHPWLLIPAIFVIIIVLAFNFLGDGLRDAADPYR